MADDTGGRAVRDLAAHGLDTRRLATESAFFDAIKALRSGDGDAVEEMKRLREELDHSRSVADSYIREAASE